jgi:hypothetical protein
MVNFLQIAGIAEESFVRLGVIPGRASALCREGERQDNVGAYLLT